MLIVCSNKPRPSIHKTGKGHQHWKREVHHIAVTKGNYKITLCGIEATEWLTIRPYDEVALHDHNLCRRCSKIVPI